MSDPPRVYAYVAPPAALKSDHTSLKESQLTSPETQLVFTGAGGILRDVVLTKYA